MFELIPFLLVYLVLVSNTSSNDTCDTYHPVVMELKEYIESNEEFALQINITFEEAGHGPYSTNPIHYQHMYQFFDSTLTLAPSKRNAMIVPHTFAQFMFTDMGSNLIKQNKTNKWIKKWLNAWKKYLNSYESAEHISTWINTIDMSDFIVPAMGYQSFNEFFTRSIKPNKRTISSLHNESIIISPVDGKIDYILHNITIDSNTNRFMVKNVEFNLLEMLNGDYEKAKKYENGTLILLSLNVNNYHHYHVYCNNAIIDDIIHIGGYYFCFGLNNEEILSGCSLDNIAACYAYWSHVNTRAIVHMKCNHDNPSNMYDSVLVAIGLGHVSSVNFIVEPNDTPLNKGDRLGNFAYGGSIICLIFPHGVIDQVVVDVKDIVQMGQAIATIKY